LALAACGGDDDDDNETPTEESTTPGDIVILDPWIRAAAADESTGTNSAAFMTLQNQSDTDERLVSAAVSDTIASIVEIHETTVDENDVMQMRPVDGVSVPAGESVELRPGGLHIMLMGLQRNLDEGETVLLTLTFESGLEKTIDVQVRPMTAME
jgi:copper(I)-binding protein